MRVLLPLTVLLLFSFSSLSQTFTGTGGSIPGTSTTQTCFSQNVTGVGVINGTLGLASVCINLTHPNVDELEIVLAAPDGTVVPLTIQNGGTGNNYSTTCFTATASTPIKFGTAPFNGAYLPEGYLGAVNNGQNANGVWRICIQDRRTAGNAGTLSNWSLNFNNSPAPQPPALPTCANTLPSNSSCATAALVCDFNGQCGSTSGSTVQDWTGSGLDGCFGLQNNSFIKFIASATTASFSVWVPTTAQATYNQGGIQMLFFSGTCNSGAVTTYGCYPHILPYSGTGQPLITVVTAAGLTPGNTYYLMIDGFNNDNCTFSIAATTGVNILNITPASPSICAGSSVNLTASGGNGTYSWSPATNLNTTTGSTVTANPSANTTYTVTSTTATGCPLTKDVTVTVNPIPAAATATITQPTCTVPTGTITISSPTGTGLQYSINGGPYQASPVFAGLPPNGIYIISVQNAANCFSPVTPFTINAAPSAPAAPTGNISQPNCTTPTGTITITSPTSAGLQYSINGGPYQPSPVFTGLLAGSYTITVQNSAGCTSPASSPFVVSAAPLPPLAPAGIMTQPTCSTPTGTIIITSPTGPGFQYSINGGPFQSSPVFAALTPGSYTVAIQNGSGCTSTSALPFVISPVPSAPPGATGTVTQPTCSTPTGTITVTSPVGPGMQYSINGGPYQSSPVFAGLNSNLYIMMVQNATGCFSSTSSVFSVNVPPVAPAAPTGTITQPSCATGTGTITITAPAGTGLQYSLNGGPYQSSPVYAGLNPNNYTITVQNASGCTSQPSSVFTISPVPSAPSTPTGNIVQPLCTFPFGQFIFNTPVGPQYEYSINGTSFQSSMVFTNILPGNYTAIVRNTGTGCISPVFSFTITTVPVPPAAPTVTFVQPNCGTNGSITVTSPLGADFEYSLNNGAFQSSPLFTGVSGTPSPTEIRVRSVSGNCTSNATVVPIIASPAAQPFSLLTRNCMTPPNSPMAGQISFFSPVGPEYEYSINGGTSYQSSPIFNNVPWNTYTVTYRVIATGCVATSQTVTLAGIPGTSNYNITQPVTCSGGGTVTVTAPLGSQYGYQLLSSTNPVIPWQASPVFNNVPPGNYTLLVGMDQCLLFNPAPIVITAVNPQAGPLNIVTLQPGCVTTTGSIIINPPAGTNLEFSINGTTYQSSPTFNNLTPGTYPVTIRNTVTGCVSSVVQSTINAVPQVPATPVANVSSQPACNDPFGTITITSPLGSQYEYSNDGGFTYQPGPVFTGLAPNTYNIIARNINSGCSSQPLALTVTPPSAGPSTPSINVLQPVCPVLTGAITVIAPVGPNLEYSINGMIYQSSNIFPNIAGGIHQVIVRDQSTTCVSQPAQVQVNTVTADQCEAIANGDIYFPTAFTPNGDGKNDGFGPGPKANLGSVTLYTLTVFNRYGEKLFETHDPYHQWNGNHKGLLQANSSFTWMARYRYGNRPVKMQKGSVTIIR